MARPAVADLPAELFLGAVGFVYGLQPVHKPTKIILAFSPQGMLFRTFRRNGCPPKNVCENSNANSVPQGRLNLAQDASPGLDLKGRPVPQGRLKIGLDEILDNLQPSLRDLVMLHDVPRTSVLG
jgi:hypothetical protein